MISRSGDSRRCCSRTRSRLASFVGWR
jgi:hypothetical protein